MIDPIHHTLGVDHFLCTGCAACAAVCPVDAIAMQPNTEGFLHPSIDIVSCTECGLCKQICPINRSKTIKTDRTTKDGNGHFPCVWAAWNVDEDIRRQSSSGGIFTSLALDVLNRGGRVVGAAFDDNFVVRHCVIDSAEKLHLLRGSKYVQSEIKPSLLHDIQEMLDQGRIVLFSGTPCQVAGFKCFLQKLYDNLYCCDIVCHGVPSPRLFQCYIRSKIHKMGKIKTILFRDKEKGWKKFSLTWLFKNGRRKSFGPTLADPYMAAFLRDFALRSSCYNCVFTTIKRQGDVTLADFWGVAGKYPEYDLDDKGTSLVLINNFKGQTWIENCRHKLFLGPADIDTAIAGNPMLVRSARRPPERETFYSDLNALKFSDLIKKYRLRGPSIRKQSIGYFKRQTKKMISAVVRLVRNGKGQRT